MNYSLFYKIIKEAQDSPEVNPASAAPPPSESPQAVQPSNANAPVAPTQKTLTADQLAGKWITDKQNFYRGKTNKYPRYADWTMSVSNQNKLREQAQKMLDADRNAAWDAYNNRNDYSGSDGFRFATTQRYESLPSVQARRQAEEAQKAQQAPMQNPVAPAAINNPATPTYTSEQDRLNQAISGVSNVYYKHFTGTHAGPGGQIFNYQMNNTLSPFYTAIPAHKLQDAFNTDINLNSLPNWGDSDVKRVDDLWQLGNALRKQQELGLNPQLTPDKQNALDFANLMRNGDGSGRTFDQLVEEVGDKLDNGGPIPPALEPIKDILIRRRKALKQGL